MMSGKEAIIKAIQHAEAAEWYWAKDLLVAAETAAAISQAFSSIALAKSQYDI